MAHDPPIYLSIYLVLEELALLHCLYVSPSITLPPTLRFLSQMILLLIVKVHLGPYL